MGRHFGTLGGIERAPDLDTATSGADAFDQRVDGGFVESALQAFVGLAVEDAVLTTFASLLGGCRWRTRAVNVSCR